MAWTSWSDVNARWLGDEPMPDESKVNAWIADAETLIVNEFPDIAGRIEDEDDSLSLATVQMVVCSMVLRVLRNPDRIRSEQLGPSARTYAGDEPGALTITADERALLAGSNASQRAFTINPTPAASIAHDLAGAWVNGPLGYEPGCWP